MSIHVSITGSPQSIAALGRFLKELETAYPCAARDASVVTDGGIIYVRAEFHTDEENLEAGDEMARISTQLQEETGVLVVLSPGTRERKSKLHAERRE